MSKILYTFYTRSNSFKVRVTIRNNGLPNWQVMRSYKS